jgi:hypothetical protein
LSQALNDEYIGLEAVQDGLWNLVYYDTLLGRFDEHTHTITGARPSRQSVDHVPGQSVSYVPGCSRLLA